MDECLFKSQHGQGCKATASHTRDTVIAQPSIVVPEDLQNNFHSHFPWITKFRIIIRQSYQIVLIRRNKSTKPMHCMYKRIAGVLKSDPSPWKSFMKGPHFSPVLDGRKTSGTMRACVKLPLIRINSIFIIPTTQRRYNIVMALVAPTSLEPNRNRNHHTHERDVCFCTSQKQPL